MAFYKDDRIQENIYKNQIIFWEGNMNMVCHVTSRVCVSIFNIFFFSYSFTLTFILLQSLLQSSRDLQK